MHFFNNQYLRYYTTNKYDIEVQDLIAIYERVKQSFLSVTKEYFVFGENHRFYSHKRKMSELEIISLSITAECLQINSELPLWAKIKKDYILHFPNLIYRATFNRRRKQLIDLIQLCTDKWANEIKENNPSEVLIIDSMSVNERK